MDHRNRSGRLTHLIVSSAPMNFLGLDPEFCDPIRSRTVVVPCPYEKTTSYLKGTLNGPSAILEASQQVELFDSETAIEASNQGIFTHPPFNYGTGTQEDWLGQTESLFLKEFQAGKFTVMLGGEHTITLAPVRAAARAFGKASLSVLHFDAHSDMRNTYHGNPYSHASIMRRVHEVVDHSYSVGIRAQCTEEREYLNTNPSKFGVLYDHERNAHGLNVERALKYLPTQKVYITIDLDYFTPEEMPSVGTPVPGGGHWYETLSFIRSIYEKREVIGVDVVELKPDHDERSNFFAAQLVYKLITYKFLRPFASP